MNGGLGPFTSVFTYEDFLTQDAWAIPDSVALTQIRNTFAGSAYRAGPVSHVISAPAGVANGYHERGELFVVSTDMMPSSLLAFAPCIDFSCFFDESAANGGLNSDGFVALQLGTIGSNAPFPAAPAAACIQARVILGANPKSQLYVSVGDGGTPATIVDGPPGNIDESMLRVRYFPGVRCDMIALDNTLATPAYRVVASVTNPALLPPQSSGAFLSRLGVCFFSGSVNPCSGSGTFARLRIACGPGFTS